MEETLSYMALRRVPLDPSWIHELLRSTDEYYGQCYKVILKKPNSEEKKAYIVPAEEYFRLKKIWRKDGVPD